MIDCALDNTLSPPEGLVFYYALALSAHHGLMAQGQGWMNFIGLNVWFDNRVNWIRTNVSIEYFLWSNNTT